MTDEKDTELSSVDVIEDVFDDSEKESEEETESEEAEKEAESEKEDSEEDEEESEGETEEDEKESDKENKEAESPSAEGNKDSKQSVPVAALMSERQRRQTAEEQLAALRKKYEPEKDGAPDPTKDPEGYKQYLRDEIIREERTRATEESRDAMIQQHADYEEMETIFMAMAQRNPKLKDEIADHRDPARFAYDTAKTYLKGHLEKERASDAAVQKKEAEAKQEKDSKAEERKKSVAKMPDLNSAASKGKNSAQVEKEPGLDDIFADQAY